MTLAETTRIALISCALVTAACGGVDQSSNASPGSNPTDNARAQDAESAARGAQDPAGRQAVDALE